MSGRHRSSMLKGLELDVGRKTPLGHTSAEPRNVNNARPVGQYAGYTPISCPNPLSMYLLVPMNYRL